MQHESEYRPNPDALLEAIKREESKTNKERGKLKIFLGMSAGVGKTYSMLEEAQKLIKEGVNVAVGLALTHGRQETAALLQGLKIIPEKEISYKGLAFKELDLDAILKLKPQLVVVDELAHSNVPGSRHPKRWQDVMEIIDNGIDVYTTLNVQHIESLRDVVESITGIVIHEAVPDQIIESATFMEVVDITPDELLSRLKAGKVYLGDQTEIAARNFFQEDHLTALREVVLRFAAEKVDHDLHGMLSMVGRPTGWKHRERLLVAVSQSPHSQKLIRTTRRLAFSLGAPWVAVHIDNGRILDTHDSAQLAKNLSLARDLGAEVITVNDPDIVNALARIAYQKGITQIIVGRSVEQSFWNSIYPSQILDKLAQQCSDIDIHVIRQSALTSKRSRKLPLFSFEKNLTSYGLVFCFVCLLTGFNWLLLQWISYKVIGVFFLLGILFLSLFFKKGPVFFAAILNALSWYIFFIPAVISEESVNEDIVFLILYFLTAVITGILTDRSRAHKEMLLKREESTRTLYEITRIIAYAPSSIDALQAIQKHLGSLLNGSCEIFMKNLDDELAFKDNSLLLCEDKEKNVAQWVFKNNKMAGWSTSTLPSAQNLYMPLKGYHDIVGVLAYQPKGETTLTTEEENMLNTVCQQLANYIERSLSEDKTRHAEQLLQNENAYMAILGIISKEIQQPIKDIKKVIDKLKDEQVRDDK